jgi:hypothetical protein
VKESTTARRMEAMRPRWSRVDLSGSASPGLGRKIGQTAQTKGRTSSVQMTNLERRRAAKAGAAQ